MPVELFKLFTRLLFIVICNRHSDSRAFAYSNGSIAIDVSTVAQQDDATKIICLLITVFICRVNKDSNGLDKIILYVLIYSIT